jgi:hypothetical protein
MSAPAQPGPRFTIVILVHGPIAIPELDENFRGPGILEVRGTARFWWDVRNHAYDLMVALHKDYGDQVRATCITPGDRVAPFHIDEAGVFHDGLPADVDEVAS